MVTEKILKPGKLLIHIHIFIAKYNKMYYIGIKFSVQYRIKIGFKKMETYNIFNYELNAYSLILNG